MLWLEGLHPGALYAIITLVSFAEGVVPVLPGDVAAGFLAFLSARAGGRWLPTTAAVVVGGVAGNSIVWWLGKRYGAAWMATQIARLGLRGAGAKAERAEQRIERAYQRYGWMALFVSRFVPGVRAMSPAAAGALGVPLWATAAIITVTSAVWYGVVTWIAFRVGTDWPSVKAAILRFAEGVGTVGLALAVVAVGVGWIYWRRHRKAAESPAAVSEGPAS
jgi:membrane-associated protein